MSTLDALRLADELDAVPENGADPDLVQEAAAELRRPHIQNAELTENLERKSVAIQRIWKERDELRRQRDVLLDALRSITAIEDQMYGPDWEEIEQARSIALAAIKTIEENT